MLWLKQKKIKCKKYENTFVTSSAYVKTLKAFLCKDPSASVQTADKSVATQQYCALMVLWGAA